MRNRSCYGSDQCGFGRDGTFGDRSIGWLAFADQFFVKIGLFFFCSLGRCTIVLSLFYDCRIMAEVTLVRMTTVAKLQHIAARDKLARCKDFRRRWRR